MPASTEPGGEEALRKLMTVLLAKVSAERALPDHMARAISLLLAIEDEAGRDLRFLDAFAVYFERAATTALLRDHPGWPSVLAAYRRAIDRFLAGGSFEAERGAIGAPWADIEHPPHAELPGAVKRVLILADHAFTAHRILNEVAAIRGIGTQVLICRGAATSRSRFIANQIKALGWTALRHPLGFARSLLGRRWSVSASPLDSDEMLDWLRKQRFDIGLHGLGVIYRPPVLNAFAIGILNAHIGFLPQFRGRSVAEWALIYGGPIGTSVFLIDEGIDTGPKMICWLPLETLPASVAALRRRLFRNDGRCYAAALRRMSEPGFRFVTNELALGRRYYLISSLLRGVAEQALADRRNAGAPQNLAQP